jgi:ketosteroid isomerase-like protein
MRFENNIISNLVIDVEARSAAFTSIATVRPNKGEAYENEQAWFLYFVEDGSKVKKVVEFCDKDAILRVANTSA